MTKVCYFDDETRTQKERDMTPAEEAQRSADIALANTPTIANYTAAIQHMLDATVQAHGYDGILSACTYADSTVPRFLAEGKACFAWRDAVWAAADLLLKSVQSGQMQAPTIPALIAMLPKMEWPNV